MRLARFNSRSAELMSLGCILEHPSPPCFDRNIGEKRNVARDETLKLLSQNLLDSMLIAFIWEFSRWWSVRVD
jgi:hypothetical protein